MTSIHRRPPAAAVSPADVAPMHIRRERLPLDRRRTQAIPIRFPTPFHPTLLGLRSVATVVRRMRSGGTVDAAPEPPAVEWTSQASRDGGAAGASSRACHGDAGRREGGPTAPKDFRTSRPKCRGFPRRSRPAASRRRARNFSGKRRREASLDSMAAASRRSSPAQGTARHDSPAPDAISTPDRRDAPQQSQRIHRRRGSFWE